MNPRDPPNRRRDGTDLEERSTLAESEQSVIFINHAGDRYIWPFELCRSFEAIKPLLEEVYILLDDSDLLEEVREGKYEIQTESGEIVLPSVWRAIVRPSTTIRIALSSQSARPDPRRVHARYESDSDNSSRSRDDDRRRIIREDDDRRHGVRRVTFERINSPVRGSEGSIEDVSSDEDQESPSGTGSDDGSTGNSDDNSSEEFDINDVRDIIPAVDSEGNKLSFTVDTTHRRHPGYPHFGSSGVDSSTDAGKDTSETNFETLRITKALSAATEDKNVIQIFTLPGPENVHLRESVGITWYHIQAERLDYNRFRNVCLAVPNLTENLQHLTREVLRKIEKEKVKAFLNGMFIEPGTVVRADISDQPEPKSVIFSCVPYFDLQRPAKKRPDGLVDRLFPSRTLMQSYYPYEPVRERDEEQAYRLLNEGSKDLITVPNLWILNIGINVIVSCGHEPLSKELVKSIEVVPEKLEQLGQADITKDSLTSIRLTDWDGRVLLFPSSTCRSYFQMEQRVKELNFFILGNVRRSIRLTQKTSQGTKIISPKSWSKVINRTDVIFVDVALTGEEDAEKSNKPSTTEDLLEMATAPSAVPPFFHWPQTSDEDTAVEKGKTGKFAPGKKNSGFCLEHAEKRMVSETLADWDTVNAVDKSFTTNAFYTSLAEDSYRDVRSMFSNLDQNTARPRTLRPHTPHHEVIIESQSADVVKKASKFFELVSATLELFVAEGDKSTMLRKVWGAMAGIYEVAAMISKRSALGPGTHSHMGPHRGHSQGNEEAAWYIRSDLQNSSIPSPNADPKFKRSIRRCKRCRSSEPFNSSEAAREHLQKHIMRNAKPEAAEESTSAGPSHASSPEPNLKDWIVNYGQLKREETNAGIVSILTLACETAKDIFVDAKELGYGVQNEDGTMSDLYTLPRQLLEAFRETIVFYLAVERALHHSEKSYQEKSNPDEPFDVFSLPFSETGLDVLHRFGQGPRLSLSAARAQLCSMVATNEPLGMFGHFALGPEYICAWLMRRLIVKPLEKTMTVGDMYRDCMSAIQFQVNHRPSKRLLRSIKLLQEELNILSAVNNWQIKLIQNYGRVLDASSYDKDIPARRLIFPFESMLLRSCLEHLALNQEEYTDLIRRCGPLADSTKQTLEINEEDHGKAIMVFTVVTVIFLPLSFVTSYLGMNTADIRDMDNLQSLFWAVALPLTLVTMGTCMYIGYQGDEIRDMVTNVCRRLTGKQERGESSARGLSVAQRKRVKNLQQGSASSTTLGSAASAAEQAEYASPRPDYLPDEFSRRLPLSTTAMPASPQPTSLRRRVRLSAIPPPPPPPFSPVQISNRLESSAPQQQQQQRPTYVRIAQRFLDADSLDYYNYSYELDPTDPTYWLIKHDLSSAESHMLFEHTNALREARAGRASGPTFTRGRAPGVAQGVRPTSAAVQDSPQYAFVRRRARVSEGAGPGRMQSTMPLGDMFFGDDGRGGGRGYTWHKARGRRRTGRGTRPVGVSVPAPSVRAWRGGEGDGHGRRDEREFFR